MTTLQQLAAAQANAEVVVNEIADTLSAAGIFGRRHPATAGLTWGYYGGYYASTLIADGTVALTASATNHIVVNRTTGAVSVATATTNWDATSIYGRLYKVTTSATGLTGVEDHRFGATGIFASGTTGVTSVNGETGAVSLSAADVGADPAGTAAAAVVGLAPLASPALTGTPTAPTAAGGTNTTQLATTAFVTAAVSAGGYTSPTTTKGDLIARSATADSRLPVGANGQVLMADSAETLGVKWAAGGAGSAAFTYAASAPGSPEPGARWLDSASGVLYTFVDTGTSTQWVEL